MTIDSVCLRLVSCNVDSHDKRSKMQFVQLLLLIPVARHVPPTARETITRCFTDNKKTPMKNPVTIAISSIWLNWGEFSTAGELSDWQRRRWDVYNSRFADSWAQILGHRTDLVSNIRILVEAGELAPAVCQSLLRLSASTTPDLSKLHDGTVILNADSVQYNTMSHSLNSCQVEQLLHILLTLMGATTFPINQLSTVNFWNWLWMSLAAVFSKGEQNWSRMRIPPWCKRLKVRFKSCGNKKDWLNGTSNRIERNCTKSGAKFYQRCPSRTRFR